MTMTEGQERLSKRVRALKPSGIRRFFNLANEMKGKVISLSIGEPDFVTPWAVREAGIYSLEQGHTHYTSNQGLLALRQAISSYVAKRFQQAYAAETEVVVTVGGAEAIDACFRACVDEGDEVILPEPCFVAYRACADLVGAKVVPISLSAQDEFRLTPEALEASITEKSKLLVLGYPNNPTGGIMRREDLEALLPVLDRHPNLLILSDELYAELNYSDEPFCSISTLGKLRERCIVVGGFSKAFAMTGWRIGYAMAPEDLAQAINKIHQFAIMSAPTTAQYAALEALKTCLPEVEKMRRQYNERRRYLYHALKEMGLEVFEPLGAFYIFPNIETYGLTSMQFCERFLREEQVAIVPGDAFGECGEGFVRISYAASMVSIQEAVQRLRRFLKKLEHERQA